MEPILLLVLPELLVLPVQLERLSCTQAKLKHAAADKVFHCVNDQQLATTVVMKMRPHNLKLLSCPALLVVLQE